ncbi:MAG: aminopeptidase [Trueperaceae bacterium]|nr:aminopeptidase [Trueperaceae bacterium]MDZ7705853.1 aminopeptidase [Trueperaceae bacterium]
MIHPLHEKYARLLVGYCTEVQPGDYVSINVDTLALPMARALYREVLEAEALPVLHLSYPEQSEDLVAFASDRYLSSEPELELTEIKQIDAYIRVRAPHNSRALQNVDKERFAALQKRNRPVQNIRVRDTRWCGTLYPTDSGAQDAGMSLGEYEQFVYNAMFLFDDDPVAKWKESEDLQAELIEHLSRAKTVRIVAEGTDLSLDVAGRSWVNSAGRKNMPSGEVFTGPHEASAQGVIRYTIPSAVNGVEVEGIELTFEDGKVVKAHADKGDDFLQAQLGTDEGARYLGELGIGTNSNIQRPTKSILYDEKIGGTVHLALGQSYQETGGTNESAVHWDMICDLRQGGAIYLDGELFQENGHFKL